MITVKIFTTQTCPYCFQLKDWLTDLNITYEEHDAANVPSIHTVPVTMVGEDGPFIGADYDNIKSALEKHHLI